MSKTSSDLSKGMNVELEAYQKSETGSPHIFYGPSKPLKIKFAKVEDDEINQKFSKRLKLNLKEDKRNGGKKEQMEIQDSENESSMDTSPAFVADVCIDYSKPAENSLDGVQNKGKEDDEGNHGVYKK